MVKEIKDGVKNQNTVYIGAFLVVLTFVLGNLYLYKADASEVKEIKNTTNIKCESMKEYIDTNIKNGNNYIKEAKQEIKDMRVENNKNAESLEKKIEEIRKSLDNKFQYIIENMKKVN